MGQKTISRRSFLKGGLAAVGAIGLGTVPMPPSARAAGGRELATLIDIRKCIGCEACVEACKDVNGFKFPEPEKPFPKMYPNRVKVADWSEDRDTTDRLTPYNWLFIQEATVTIDGKEETLTIPRRCMHCQNPPCADLCPWGAARKLKNGITLIHPDICLGGSKCKKRLPLAYSPAADRCGALPGHPAPSFAGNGVMFKCDRCYNRIEKGELPACIEICPEKVQDIGPRDEIVRKAHAIAKEIGGYIYGEKENGGTNTIYVSPVPFKELNRAIEKGPGRPHLKSVEDSMAHADNLAKAMVIAPFAGIAAAAAKIIKTTKSQKNSDGKNT